MKIRTLLFILSLVSISGIFAQDNSDSLNTNLEIDSVQIAKKFSQDSLNAVNSETINHIKSIFAKSGNKRPTIGLALAGGGAKGFAHAGILQLIDSLDIPVDYIAGNSMGGLVAALYSIGYSGKDLEEYGVGLDWNSLLNDNPERIELPFIEKKKTGIYQLSVGLKGYQPTVPSGMIYGQNIQMEFISMTAPFEDVQNFDDLPIPFRCVAVDLVTGKEEVLKSGSLSKAMRSTMSIPSAFSPIDWDKFLLVDGMVLNNFPVDVVKRMGADIVIGLNLTTGRMEKEDLTDLLSILNRTVDIPTGGRLEENIQLSDIYVSQNVDGYSTADFASNRIEEIIERGKEAGVRNFDVFLALREELEKYEDYQNWKSVGKKNKQQEILNKREEFKTNPPTISKINIVGNKKFESDFILAYLRIKNGDKLNTIEIEKKINALYALNYFETVTYQIQNVDNEKVEMLVQIKEKPVNKIVAGFRYNDHFKLIGLFGVETNSAVIQGAQLEAYFKFGGLTAFDITILFPSRSMDIPLYPFLEIKYKDIPIDFYFGGKKTFRYKDRSWDFSGGLNFSLSKFWDFEASMFFEKMNVVSDISSNEIDSLIADEWPNAGIVAGKLKLLYDSLDDVILPNFGIYFEAKLEISMKDLGSDIQYHKYSGLVDYFIPVGKKQNINLSGSYRFASSGTPFYKWFYIGGPNTFSGIDYFQANGTEMTVLRASYRYEFLKDLYIRGIYNVMFNYNMGRFESPIRGVPIVGGAASIIFRTMFGRAEIMWARGDANMYNPGEKSNQFYFTFGYNLE